MFTSFYIKGLLVGWTMSSKYYVKDIDDFKSMLKVFNISLILLTKVLNTLFVVLNK